MKLQNSKLVSRDAKLKLKKLLNFVAEVKIINFRYAGDLKYSADIDVTLKLATDI